MTYSAGISFLDAQLGRILDVMDNKNLWDTTTVILTSDHGMHNGEKGMWEKWTLFGETTRVPLLISHPKSPNKGTRYSAEGFFRAFFRIQLELLDDVSDFLLREQWYLERALKYQRVYLLHGPPGNGKSSFLQALAVQHQMPFFALQLSSGVSEGENHAKPLPRLLRRLLTCSPAHFLTQ